MTKIKLGILYVVATPIGNLQDITFRAIEILKNVDLIAAEDTRRASILLKHFSINKPSLSLHNFNENKQNKNLLAHLQQGKHIALISDAGTPLISDPGFLLVKQARDQGIQVIPIPGPCAAITALSAAGLPTDKFIFEGFLPEKKEAREKQLTRLMEENRTLIFYEAPHRLLRTLQSLLSIFGETRKIVIARELTKIHESIQSGNSRELIDHFTVHKTELRGEMVILVHGNDHEPSQAKKTMLAAEEVLKHLMQALPTSQAISLAAKITGENKNKLYKLALEIQALG